MSAVIHFPMSFVKISRHGERFWLKNIKQEGEKWSGVVDNMLEYAPYACGQRIVFEESEVVDSTDKRTLASKPSHTTEAIE